MADELPPVVTRLTADVQGLADGLVKGKALVQAFKQEVAAEFGGGGVTGERLGKDLGDGLGRGLADAEGSVRSAAEASGQDAGDAFGKGLLAKMYPAAGWRQAGDGIGKDLGEGLSNGVEPGLDDADRKIKDKAGQAGKDAGNAAGQGMSPLIISAIAGAATIGGPLLLAGIGGAMVGATALVLKQNQVISADFQKVGKDAGTMVQSATAPLTGELHAALTQTDQQITGLQPEFKSLFSGALPDITAVTSGLTGLVGGVLPGLSQAVTGGQVIVSDFSKALPALGQNVGGFFSGLVHDANIQGQALNQTIGALGSTVRTAGSLIGSASAAASTDLLALTPVINGLNTAIRAVASPATVGGVTGLFGAMKLGSGIQSGLLSGAEGLSKVADKAEEAGGVVGKLSGAAGGASGALAKMAGIAGGPWGLAIGAGIGLVSGLVAALSNADDATKAITVDQAALSAAVAKDGATAGDATSAYIAAQAQLSGLADEAKNAGVPLDLLTQAAIGNKQALSEVVTATGHANEAQRQSQLAGSLLVTGQGELNNAMSTGVNRLNESTVSTNTLTVANQQLLNSVRAQAQQVADAITKQSDLNAAMIELNSTTNIFNATLSAEYQKLQLKAQTTGQNAAAALNLGTNQAALNMSLADAVQQYTQATDGANGYQSVLTALNGTTNQLLGSEASFTLALAGVAQAVSSNGHSLDVNNDKGAQNIQTFTQLAASAQKAADAVYQNEVNTKGATVAYTDANAKLAAEKQAFIDAADKAGFNKGQVQALANELFQLPKSIPIDIPITADPQRAIDLANGAVKYIDSLTGVITIVAQTSGGGVSYNPKSGGKALYDYGGWTKAAPGQPEEAIVHGGEYMLSADMLAGRQPVDARVLASLRASLAGVGVSGGGSGPAGFGGAAGSSGGVTVYAPIYLDSRMIGQATTTGTRAGAQQFARYNAITGLAGNYS